MCLFLDDLSGDALAKSILVSQLEVKYLRLRTAGPELQEGSSGSFPTAPRLSFEDRTSWPVPGKSLKPYVSDEDFLEGSGQQKQSLGYKWQICCGNRSLPQIATPSPGTPPHSGNGLWPAGLRSTSFPRPPCTPQASPLALCLEPTVQETCLFSSAGPQMPTLIRLTHCPRPPNSFVHFFPFPIGQWLPRTTPKPCILLGSLSLTHKWPPARRSTNQVDS